MLITSSRRTSPKARIFCKELESVIPLSFYLLRGKKSLRSIIDLAYEKGMDRLCIIETKKEEPSRISFIKVDLDWRWIGHMDISASLRGEKIPSIDEDIELAIQGKGKYLEDLAYFFNASSEDSYAILYLENNTINFYRKDIYSNLVGPEIKIVDLCRHDKNGQNDQT